MVQQQPCGQISVLNEISELGDLVAGVSACAMRKEWIDERHARAESNLRYNYSARFALEKGGLFDPAQKKRVTLTIDQRNLRATESMRGHLKILREAGELCCDVDLKSGNSQRVSGLQGVDFVAGAIAVACDREEWKYVNVLKKRSIPVLIRQPGWKKKKDQAGETILEKKEPAT